MTAAAAVSPRRTPLTETLEPRTLCSAAPVFSPLAGLSKPVAVAAKTIPANAENRYEVTAADLPLSCPMPGMSLWNSHPKVYLPVEATGSAKCPYCGAVFTLKS